MSMQSDRIPESASPPREAPAFDAPPTVVLALDEQAALDLHRQINARRAQVENPELLRRLRSL